MSRRRSYHSADRLASWISLEDVLESPCLQSSVAAPSPRCLLQPTSAPLVRSRPGGRLRHGTSSGEAPSRGLPYGHVGVTRLKSNVSVRIFSTASPPPRTTPLVHSRPSLRLRHGHFSGEAPSRCRRYTIYHAIPSTARGSLARRTSALQTKARPGTYQRCCWWRRRRFGDGPSIGGRVTPTGPQGRSMR